MKRKRNSDAQSTAEQYLVWALGEIEKLGDETAEHHVRLALDRLQSSHTDPKNKA